MALSLKDLIAYIASCSRNLEDEAYIVLYKRDEEGTNTLISRAQVPIHFVGSTMYIEHAEIEWEQA